VYLRQNIVENIKTDEMSGKETVFYEYEEAKLTKEEYEEYKKQLDIINIEKQRADIDFLALLTGADLGY
jgi:heme oxygenase